MLFTGGALNRRLLGGEGAVEIPSQATKLSSKGLSESLVAWLGISTAPSPPRDRKSTRLNSSHLVISYAVFCLKKKKHLTERYLMLNTTCTSLRTPIMISQSSPLHS